MKKVNILLIVVLFLVSFSVMGAHAFVEKGGVKIFKLATVDPIGSTADGIVNKWAELVDERSNGKMKIEIFPNEQLGVEKATLQGTIMGAIDLSTNDTAYHAGVHPAMGVFDFPYTFRDFEHYRNVVTGPVFRELADLAGKEEGLRILTLLLFGRRQVCSNVPFFTPDDTKGLKMRTPTNKLALESARVLGAEPTAIDYGEAYLGLKQGLADAAENPFTGIYDMKWYEATKYLIVTSHVMNSNTLCLNLDAWNSLSPEEQQILQETANMAAEFAVDQHIELEDKRMNDLKEFGMHIIIPSSLKPFRELAAEIEKSYREEYSEYNWGEWHDRVMNTK